MKYVPDSVGFRHCRLAVKQTDTCGVHRNLCTQGQKWEFEDTPRRCLLAPPLAPQTPGGYKSLLHPTPAPLLRAGQNGMKKAKRGWTAIRLDLLSLPRGALSQAREWKQCWAASPLVRSQPAGLVHCWFSHILLEWFIAGSLTSYWTGSQLVQSQLTRMVHIWLSQSTGLIHHWFSHNLQGCFTAGSVTTYWAVPPLVQSQLTGLFHHWFSHNLLGCFTAGSVTTYWAVSPLVQSQLTGLFHHWFSHNLPQLTGLFHHWFGCILLGWSITYRYCYNS